LKELVTYIQKKLFMEI